MTTDPAKYPIVRIPEWCTTTDVYSDPGKQWDGAQRKEFPGSLVVDGYSPDDQPTAVELNYQLNAAGEWLNYLSQIGINNFYEVQATGVASPAVDVDYLNNLWLAVSNTQVMRSTNGEEWVSSGITGGATFQRVIPLDTIAVLINSTGDTVYRTDGLATVSHLETTSPSQIMGAVACNGQYTLVGLGAGPDIFFQTTATETDIGTIDVPLANNFGVPTLGGTAADTATNWSSDRTVFSAIKEADNRAIVLVSYRNTSGQVFQYVTSDNGVSWVETPSVIELTDNAAASGLAGVAYDTIRNLWVCVTQDAAGGEVYTSPVGAESWTHAGTIANAVGFDGLTIIGGVWYVFDTGGKMSYSTDGGLFWSDGFRFRSAANTVTATYAPAAGQWALIQADEAVALSLKVGTTNTVAITPP